METSYPSAPAYMYMHLWSPNFGKLNVLTLALRGYSSCTLDHELCHRHIRFASCLFANHVHVMSKSGSAALEERKQKGAIASYKGRNAGKTKDSRQSKELAREHDFKSRKCVAKVREQNGAANQHR